MSFIPLYCHIASSLSSPLFILYVNYCYWPQNINIFEFRASHCTPTSHPNHSVAQLCSYHEALVAEKRKDKIHVSRFGVGGANETQPRMNTHREKECSIVVAGKRKIKEPRWGAWNLVDGMRGLLGDWKFSREFLRSGNNRIHKSCQAVCIWTPLSVGESDVKFGILLWAVPPPKWNMTHGFDHCNSPLVSPPPPWVKFLKEPSLPLIALFSLTAFCRPHTEQTGKQKEQLSFFTHPVSAGALWLCSLFSWSRLSFPLLFIHIILIHIRHELLPSPPQDLL